MRKRIDYRRVGRQILIFLFILALGLLNLKAQVLYSEDFSASPNGASASPKWEVDVTNAAPGMFCVMAQQFECKNVRGEAVWRSTIINISGFDFVDASVSVAERGQMDADDYIRVYYNVDGSGEVLFSDSGNKPGMFRNAKALQKNIEGSSLQISVHVKNDKSNERHSFDNIRVEAHPKAYVWIGMADSVWSNPANWSSGLTPSGNDDVIISALPPFQPVISGEAGCKSLMIEENAVLTMSVGSVLSVSQDLKCFGRFSPGKGTVEFTGIAPQIIESKDGLTFHNLDIANRSVAGTFAHGNVIVRNRFMLSDGLFTTSDTVVLLNPAPEALETYSDSSYIVGKLQRKIKEGVEAMYHFPVGIEGKFHYHHASIEANGLQGTRSLTVSFEPDFLHMPSYLNTGNGEFAYDFYIREGMWVITPDVEPVAGWYDLRLSVENVTGLGDNLFGIIKRPRGADARAWNAEFGTENVFGGEGRKLSDGYGLKKYCTSFSEFTLAGSGVAIPIDLLEFKATLANGKVNLHWSTATETGNDYFTIEKSNGTDFKEVVKVNAMGNSSTLQKYSAVDDKPFTGISYYRLKQTDFSGKSEYSDVVSVKNVSDNQFIIFPNPGGGSVKLKFNASLPKLDVVIFNQHGTISYNKTFITQGASSVMEIQLKDELPAGIYYMQVSGGQGDIMVQQIVIQ